MEVYNRVSKLLKTYESIDQHLWDKIISIRKEKGNELPDWKNYCYCPLDFVAFALKTSYNGNSLKIIEDISIVTALSAWRMTKSIYIFNEDIFNELWNTPLEQMPIEVIYRLPEWCVFIEAPKPIIHNQIEIIGWFCFINDNTNHKRDELHFVIIDKNNNHFQIVLPLCSGTIAENANKIYNFKTKNFSKFGQLESFFKKGIEYIVSEINITELLTNLISVTLYLCAENKDILSKSRTEPRNPIPTKTKKGNKLFPLAPAIWEVGFRVSKFIKEQSTKIYNNNYNENKGLLRRPHYRKAHWHSYWTGKRGTEEQKIILKWLYPTLVNVSEGEIIMTITKID